MLLILIAALPAIGIAAFPSAPQDQTAPRAQQTTESETLDSLRTRINAIIGQPAYETAQWGIKVASLETGRTLFEQRPNAYFNPASNAKLFTTALALARLGPEYRIKTTLFSTVPPDSAGLIKGDLVVYGRGDPTMAARLNEGDYYKALEPL